MDESSFPVEKFRAYIETVRNVSEHTCRAYATDLIEFRQFLAQTPDIELRYIDRSTIRHYLTNLYVAGKSRPTISRKLSALRTFFRFMVNEGLLAQSPVLDIKLGKRQKKLPRFLTLPEVTEFIEAPDTSNLAGLRDRAILEVLYSSGVRVSELVGLNRDVVDLISDIIKVRGKGKKERLAPLGKKASDALRNYLGASIRFQGKGAERDRQAVFLNRDGQRITARSVRRIIDKYVKKTALKKHISPHVFRHTFATHLLDAGADLRSIQELLGHARLSSTEIYTHVSTEKMRDEYLKHHPRA